MAIIGAECLRRILKDIKTDHANLNQLSAEEAGKIFDHYLNYYGPHEPRPQGWCRNTADSWIKKETD